MSNSYVPSSSPEKSKAVEAGLLFLFSTLDMSNPSIWFWFLSLQLYIEEFKKLIKNYLL